MLRNRQTNKQSNTIFDRNLAMVVIYLPTKFDFNRTNVFWVRLRKRQILTDRRTSYTPIQLVEWLHATRLKIIYTQNICYSHSELVCTNCIAGRRFKKCQIRHEGHALLYLTCVEFLIILAKQHFLDQRPNMVKRR